MAKDHKLDQRAWRQAHTGCMGRMIGRILGAILAVWLAFTAIHWIFPMLRTFAVIGVIAVVVGIIVWVLAGRARRDDTPR
jgi:Flp pilus assembly protein TadB